VYIASSWKNAVDVRRLANGLRFAGHQVYAFCEEGAGHYSFDFRQAKDAGALTAGEMLKTDQARHAFEADKGGLDWATDVILLLPAGRSSHLEAGYAVGLGKRLFIVAAPVAGEWDVMYAFADAICESFAELLAALGKEA
jgi:hypothetical protein